MSLLIRPYGPGDSLEVLTALLRRAYAPLAELGFRYLTARQRPETTAARIENATCFLGFLEGRLAASITLSPPERTRGCPWYDRPDVGCFGQFGVEPELQRQGIGSRMLAHLEAQARISGTAELALDTAESAEHLIRYYRKHGYRLVGHADWRPITNYRSVVMSKPLAPPSEP